MNKKSIVVCILLLAATLAFSLEFRLEYQKRINLYLPHSACFFSDNEVIFTAVSNEIRNCYILNIETNVIKIKPLSYVDDLISLGLLLKLNDSEYVISYTDSSSTSWEDKRIALINVDAESYKTLSGEELSQARKIAYQFDYDKSNILFDDYQLLCYVDSEAEDVNLKTGWADDGFSKIKFIVSDSVLQGWQITYSADKIKRVIQTLQNEEGEDLIIGFHESSVYYDSEREKLIILSDFGYDKNGEPDLDFKYDLYIYKLIYDATCNNTHVRIREEPNLSCSTLGYLNTGDAVKVTDKSDAPFEIDGESWYWYKVESDSLPDGWVYGKYLDIEE